MRKFLLTVLFISFTFGVVFGAEGIFNYPSNAKEISSKMPKLRDVSCKFTQEKHIGSAILKSGGNFKFVRGKGAIFETLYPIKSTVSYNSSQNKQMNDVIVAISNKNYSYLDRNFDLYYVRENNYWTVGLKPKHGSAVSSQLNYIIVKGETDISNIKIGTVKNGITDIFFKCEAN